MRPIFLDYHSTTPVDRRVLEAMLPYFTERFGNAASRTHALGWEAEEAVERAREQVAAAISASSKEIVFTSGATESNNLALLGVMRASRRRHLVTVATEHKAVLDCCQALAQEGVRVTALPVGPDGRVDPALVLAALDDDTALVSVMHANNEIGTIQPLAELAVLCHARGVLLHTDAAQSLGKLELSVHKLGVDLASLSAHKLYGPKGVGALYVRRHSPRLPMTPLFHGGGHERGLRPGTLPVPLCVGFGEAAALAERERPAEAERLLRLRGRLLDGLRARLDHVEVNGSLEHRLPGNLSLRFGFVEGNALMMGLKRIAVSSGSACTSATQEPSHVLAALGLPEDDVFASLRFGLGRFTTDDDIDVAVDEVATQVTKLRALSPRYRMR